MRNGASIQEITTPARTLVRNDTNEETGSSNREIATPV